MDFLVLGDHVWMDKTQTVFKEVNTLSPAHQLILTGGRTTIRRYWDLPTDVPLLRYRREEEYLEHFRSVFRQAVEDRLRCNDVVISMSGGTDSSAIAAVSQNSPRESLKFGLHAITVVYDNCIPAGRDFIQPGRRTSCCSRSVHCGRSVPTTGAVGTMDASSADLSARPVVGFRPTDPAIRAGYTDRFLPATICCTIPQCCLPWRKPTHYKQCARFSS